MLFCQELRECDEFFGVLMGTNYLMKYVNNIVVNSVKQQARVYTECTILLSTPKFPYVPESRTGH